jgi:quaternary ammonium compound-resistance protein SugE
MSVVLALSAASCFAAGGLLMKPAEGLSRLGPTLAMVMLFMVGACCLTMVVHRGGAVGPAYLVVVGLETVLVFMLAVAVFGESVTADRLLALVLVLTGTTLLARGTV